ncbi:MAG TPA: nitroreductase family protein [Candidatus Limiplasma sp.]|nr:nitroreductase family protein [Candidatus Limiplasma sp.]
MELFDAIVKRHSYRCAFTADPIPEADLMKIAEAGVRAPSGCNKQTTHFCIVNDPETLRAIAALLPRRVVQSAQAVLVVVTDNRPAYGDMSFEPQDYGAAVENMLLAITALGYATVWLDGVLRHDGLAEKFADLIHLTDREHFTVSVILPIGVPEQAGAQNKRLPIEQRVTWNTMD